MLRNRGYILFVFILFCKSAFVRSFYDERQKVEYITALLNICEYQDGKSDCKVSFSGRYGENSPNIDVDGDLQIPKSRDGCKPFEFRVKRYPWIALVSSVDNCTFKQKILNALNHNASAVIIYDIRELKGALSHPGTGNIVVVTTSHSFEKEIDSLLSNVNTTIRVKITVGETVQTYLDSQTSILFVSISFVVLMVISLAWLVFYYVQRFRYHHARDKTEKRLTSAAKKAIAKLPNRTVKKGENDDNESCAVCLETYEPDDVLRIMPCKHEFHKTCVDPWLIEHRTCPMCKLNILQELGLLKPEDVTMDMETIVEESPAPYHSNDDHNSAADNHAAEYEEDGSRDGSVEEGGSVLQVSAELNWERDRDSSRSTTSLVQTGTLA